MPCLRFNVKDDVFFSLDLPYLANAAFGAPPQPTIRSPMSNTSHRETQATTAVPPINANQAYPSQPAAHLYGQTSTEGGAQSATARCFAHNSEVITLAATRQNSVQLHDYNSNTVLLITLNDSSSTSSTSSHHTTTTRDGNSTASESVAHDSEADESDDDHSHVSELTPSEISSDENHIQSLLKRLQISPTSHVIASALDQLKNVMLPPHEHDVFMQSLDNALQALDSNKDVAPLHPDLRAEVHFTLAQYFSTKGYSSRQRSLRHCNCGLLLLYGRERLFPKLAADLHLLTANLLLLIGRAQRPMHQIFSHIRAARVALLACHGSDNVDRHVDLFVVMGFAHSVCTARPVCEHLLAGYDAYMCAIEMVRLGADSVSTPWMQLTCVAAQLALRFLRHRRHALEDPKSPCHSSPTAACRIDLSKRISSQSGELLDGHDSVQGACDGTAWTTNRPDVRMVDIDDVLQMVDDVRRKLTATLEGMLDGDGDGEIYGLEQRLSVAHECVGRCYVERSYAVHQRAVGRSKVDDLRKGCSALQSALRSCEWSDEYAGQRYVALSELLEESRRRLAEAEAVESLNEQGEEEDGEMEDADEWDDSLWDEIAQNKGDCSGRDSTGCGSVQNDFSLHRCTIPEMEKDFDKGKKDTDSENGESGNDVERQAGSASRDGTSDVTVNVVAERVSKEISAVKQRSKKDEEGVGDGYECQKRVQKGPWGC